MQLLARAALRAAVLVLAVLPLVSAPSRAQNESRLGAGMNPSLESGVQTPPRPPTAEELRQLPSPVPLVSRLDPNYQPIDLGTTLRLAGVQNPELMLARQRVVEAVALRQLAAAQMLPTINAGTNYDTHTGNLQQANGNILSVNRSAVYVGAGANAVAAGSVSIPGVFLNGNIAEVVYGWLVARQLIHEREFTSLAVRNQTLLAAALAYSELLRTEGRRAVALQVRDEADQVYRLVASYAKVGQNKQSDADRAATELTRRQAEVDQLDGDVQIASARLCEVLNLDPSVRLHPTDSWVVPMQLVPPPMPIGELLTVALLRRPELAERRVAIQQALLTLEGARVLPFSPTLLIGYSAGGFGGGSNLVKPVFGSFSGRMDVDAISYWSLRNLAVGNLAMIDLAKAQLRTTQLAEIAVMDRVRAEVAEAYAKTHARFALITTTEQAVRSATSGFHEDFTRARGAVGLPIEVLDSLRLLADSRFEYLNSIVDYNRAQFEIYVAVGQPPAAALARPVPTSGVVATNMPADSSAAAGRAAEPVQETPGPPVPPPANNNGPFANPPGP